MSSVFVRPSCLSAARVACIRIYLFIYPSGHAREGNIYKRYVRSCFPAPAVGIRRVHSTEIAAQVRAEFPRDEDERVSPFRTSERRRDDMINVTKHNTAKPNERVATHTAARRRKSDHARIFLLSCTLASKCENEKRDRSRDRCALRDN